MREKNKRLIYFKYLDLYITRDKYLDKYGLGKTAGLEDTEGTQIWFTSDEVGAALFWAYGKEVANE